MEQVLFHLVANARDAISEGGRIDISLQVVTGEALPIEQLLLVEEDEISRKLALSTLQRHRYHVLEARSAVEALLVVQQQGGPIHLTVSHLSMAEISGRELATRLAFQHPKMKALFLSGFSDETMTSHRVKKKYFLQRPYRQQELAGKIRELLDS